MSEEHREGWEAPFRGPMIALAVLLAVLLGGVVAAGSLYRAHVQRATRPPVAALRTFPSPRLETLQTAPGERRPDAPRPPAALTRAMAETAAEGDALWGRAQP